MAMESPWAHSSEQVLQHFGVDPTVGLAPDQVQKHVQLYGKNGRIYSNPLSY